MNPYTLPDGHVAIAFSGGRTSAYMLHHILEANGGLPERAVVSFQNTGREMPETLDFVQECGDRWGVRIVCRGHFLRSRRRKARARPAPRLLARPTRGVSSRAGGSRGFERFTLGPWGTRERQRPCGRSAERCPVCRPDAGGAGQPGDTGDAD